MFLFVSFYWMRFEWLVEVCFLGGGVEGWVIWVIRLGDLLIFLEVLDIRIVGRVKLG